MLGGLMVMNPMVESVKNHLKKQIQVIVIKLVQGVFQLSRLRKPTKPTTGKCLTPSQLLICSSFSRENCHLLLICSSLSTSQTNTLRQTTRPRAKMRNEMNDHCCNETRSQSRCSCHHSCLTERAHPKKKTSQHTNYLEDHPS